MIVAGFPCYWAEPPRPTPTSLVATETQYQ